MFNLQKSSVPGHRSRSQLLLILASLLFAGVGQANDWLPKNTRATLDFSGRVNDSAGTTWSQYAVGLDVHKVFSGRRGDIGVLTFQPYLVGIRNAPMVPGIFDDNDDWALQWRIANFNYTGIAQGRFNIRLGHMEVPFGLEQVIQTNGTIYQLPRSGTLKADWGVSINGMLPWFEYELARTQGSGNDLSSDADGLLAGRIGLPRDRWWWAGLSALDGEIERGPSLVEQRLYALDAGIRLPRGFGLMLQHSQGEEDLSDVEYNLAEVNWTTPVESTFVYSQWRHGRRELAGASTLNRDIHLGLRFEPNASFAASFELRHHLDATENDLSGSVQLRYRL